jgi:hypothetical protein
MRVILVSGIWLGVLESPPPRARPTDRPKTNAGEWMLPPLSLHGLSQKQCLQFYSEFTVCIPCYFILVAVVPGLSVVCEPAFETLSLHFKLKKASQKKKKKKKKDEHRNKALYTLKSSLISSYHKFLVNIVFFLLVEKQPFNT